VNICNGCDREYINGYCAACDEYACDALPEKTLDQFLSERPDLRAYRDEVRARLWGVETVADPLRRVA
jgi:hypothetical protein